MGNNVFANGREISCKSGEGKSICAFPDVCMTPPENPATPPGVPIPYPNTGLASDTTDGSKSVQISGKEIMLKNKSYFKKSTGDEAGCAAKKGVVTSVNRGKVYFIAWSMDVQVEGENAVRHLDMTTHNHASPVPNTVTWPFLDQAAFESPHHPCHTIAKKVENECDPLLAQHKTKKGKIKRKAAIKAMCDKEECNAALQCVLQPHTREKENNNCCDGKTTHHLVPSSAFISNAQRKALRGKPDPVTRYSDVGAPCVCVEGDDHNDPLFEHGIVGRYYDKLRTLFDRSGQPLTLEKAIDLGAESGSVVGCPKSCLEAQLKRGHRQMKLTVKEKDPVPRQ
jgi:hypothetical protein